MPEETGTKKILVVEDEPDVISYFSMLLEDNGYTALTADNADEGFELACSEKPDLICIDIMMPRRSGLALYKDIKRNDCLRDIPVVIVSSFGQPDDFKGTRFHKLVSGTDDIPAPEHFCEKPVSPGELLRTVRRLTSGPENVKESAAGNS